MQTDLIKKQGAKIKKYIKKFPVRKKFHFTGLCSNCDQPVDGKFCTNCGQSAKNFHRPFFTVVSESLSEAISLDNKFFHTLIPLFVKPGYLTKEFMRGRRSRYTPPFRLYLFLTFFAFLLVSHNHKPETESEKNLSFKNSDGTEVNIMSFIDEIPENNIADTLNTDSLNKKIDTTKTNHSISVKNNRNHPSNIIIGYQKIRGNKSIKNLVNMWKLNPALIMDKAFKKMSQTLLLILPVFALFLGLFYIRRKRYMLEHLLISLNFHSFIFVIVIISELLIITDVKIIVQLAPYLYLLIPIQLFLTLKFYYKQSWIKSFIKFMMLSFLYNILLFTGILYSLISLIN